jgi:hypothetical protein
MAPWKVVSSEENLVLQALQFQKMGVRCILSGWCDVELAANLRKEKIRCVFQYFQGCEKEQCSIRDKRVKCP